MVSFIVSNSNDSGIGSLRQAILDANSTIGADVIQFDSSLANQSIYITSGVLPVTDSLTINGLGADLLTIDAQGNSTIFSIDNFNVVNRADVVIDGLTITGGSSSLGSSDIYGYAGAIFNDDNLTVSNSLIVNNQGIQGGGIFTTFNGNLNVISSTIANNTARNIGGGIYSSGQVQVVNSTISGNVSGRDGGGLGTTAFFTQTLTNTTITGNVAIDGGGLYSSPFFSNIALNNSIVAGNIDTDVTITDSPDVSGNFSSNTHNIIGFLQGSSGLTSDLVIPNTDQILNPFLSYDGSPTPTHALVVGSPAIDAGENTSVPAGINTDQRGIGFSRIVNQVVDIGAIEQQQDVPNIAEPSALAGILITGLILVCTRTHLHLRD
jgi:predicted outer membrane repeat protein